MRRLGILAATAVLCTLGVLTSSVSGQGSASRPSTQSDVTAGESLSIEFSYTLPGRVAIPEGVKRLAVAPVIAVKGDGNGTWADETSRMLAAALDAANRPLRRFEIIDLTSAAKAPAEPNDPIAYPSRALQRAKQAGAHAVFRATVSFEAADEAATRQYFDVFSQTMKTKPYTKRSCRVTLDLQVDDVQTGRPLGKMTIAKAFDSDDPPGGMSKVMGLSSDSPPPLGDTLRQLLDSCVQDAVAGLGLRRVTVKERLEGGTTEAVRAGNKLAQAKDYAAALAAYKKALAADPDDDGAAFNAGLACEAMGDLQNAEKYYSLAAGTMSLDRYLRARNRVRAEIAASQPPGTQPTTAPAATKEISLQIVNMTSGKLLAQLVQGDSVVAQAEVPPESKATLAVRKEVGQPMQYSLKAAQFAKAFTLDMNSSATMVFLIAPSGITLVSDEKVKIQEK